MAGTQTNQSLPVLWTFAGIMIIFIALRLYTRLVVVRRIGWDDYIYVAATVLLGIFVGFLQLAAVDAQRLAPNQVGHVGWEIMALSVVFLATAVAKCSLGVFLLRLVVKKCQRVVIWAFIGIVLVFSLGVITALWINCVPLPSTSIFGLRSVAPMETPPKVPEHSCSVDIILLLKFYGYTTVAADLAFAILPWFSLYSLKMPRCEKLIIGASLSLGIVALACGIVRNVCLDSLSGTNYLDYHGGFIFWSGAEVFVTLLCNGIPVLRPLLRHWWPQLVSKANSPHASPKGDCELGLYTIGGGHMNGAARGGQQMLRTPRKAHLALTRDRTLRQSDEEDLVSRMSVCESNRNDGLMNAEQGRSPEDDLERGPEMGTEKEIEVCRAGHTSNYQNRD